MNRVGQQSVRKVRCDKKKEVKPVLTIELKDVIYRLGYITSTPVKDVCEYLCVSVLSNPNYIDELSKYFLRNFRIGSTIKIGNLYNNRVKKRTDGTKERVTIKFKQPDYEVIYNLGYALDVSASRAVAILLELAMMDMNIINQYIKHYLKSELTDYQIHELKLLLRYINSVSNQHHTWASLMGHIIDETGSPLTRLKDVIRDFLTK